MKKYLGVILMVVAYLLLVVLALATISLFANPDLEGWRESSVMGLLFFSIVVFFVLIMGRKLFIGDKKSKPAIIVTNSVNEVQRVELEVKLERLEWIKLNFLLGYSNRVVLIVTAIGLGMSYVVVNYLTSNSFNLGYFPVLHLLFGIFCLLIIPVLTYIQAIKTLNQIQTRNYVFANDSIQVINKSGTSSLNWSEIKLIKESTNWYMLFAANKVGLFIPKNQFLTLEQESAFRGILKNQQGIEMKFRK